MNFAEFNAELSTHITSLLKNNTPLFVTDVDKDLLWITYLDSFPTGTNEIFRERREFDCQCCRRFIRSFGNVVVIVNNKPVSIWDFTPSQDTFKPVVKALAELVKSTKIRDVFVSRESRFGAGCTWEHLPSGSTRTWDHFFYQLPSDRVHTGRATEESVMGEKRDTKNVFRRSLEELSLESVDTVLELIAQKSLYKGEEWQEPLQAFRNMLAEYEKLPTAQRHYYCWAKSLEVGPVIGRIRNHSIGVLLQYISSEKEDLDTSVSSYERIVAPTNYKRPKAVFTKKMVDQAQATVAKLGLLDSLPRRHATLDDISVNDILFANRDSAKHIGLDTDIFAALKQESLISLKKFDRVEEVPIDRFVEEILPKASSIEALFENRHVSSLVSLIAPQNLGAKSLFKWDNNFGWAYNGNITDSMKERVKKAGGNVNGVLRFSIQWNDNDDNYDDLDAHCIEPNGQEIYFRDKRSSTGGELDVDIIYPKEVAVENITWPSEDRMLDGVYHFFVHCYSTYLTNGAKSGFSAEIEYDGQIYSYSHPHPLRQGEKITVAKLKLVKGKGIEFIESGKYLQSSSMPRSVWGLTTGQFVPVSVLMRSPNYWEGQKGVGHQHYFFMLKGCRNEDSPNGFFNEFLHEDLMKHKRVFEALGGKMRVEPCDDQLSGIGFSSTKRNSVICKVSGSFSRTLKILF